jgi:hypothetical protein
MLSAKRPQSASDVEFSWYQLAPRIKAGHVGFEARRLVVEILRPSLKTERAFEWRENAPVPGDPEALHHLIRLDFQPQEHPPPKKS